ncbi:hypothetical protein BH20CHL2_BH20CHL2_06690 [soil metagenome]
MQTKVFSFEVDRGVGVEQARNDLQSFLEAGKARRYIAEVVAEHGVFPLHPAGANAQDHATVAEVIEGGCPPRQHHRIADRKRRDHRAEADPLRVVRQVGECDNKFQRLIVGRIDHDEVVGQIQTGETPVFDYLHQALPVGP